MPAKRESVRLFENDLLEKFSHVHPITPLILWAPVISYFLYRAVVLKALGLTAVLGLVSGGFFFWTLFEYLLHRFVFHLKPTGWLQERFVYIMHGNHHDIPDDATRLVMPPLP